MKKVRLTYLALLAALFISTHTAKADGWEAKQGPMMTPWAEHIDPANIMPEYPRPQMQRPEWMNLNGLWNLRKGIAGEPYSSTFEYDKEILVPFPIESALSGVMEKSDEQCYWYRRKFVLPESMTGRNILLHFGAVDWETVVYVNGTKVGSHTGGYDPFYFDITPALKKGGEQEIAVYIYDNTGVQGQPTGKQSKNPSICWYTAVSGIWQSVWLEPVNNVYITDMEIEPCLDQRYLRLRVNTSMGDNSLAFNAIVKDKEGKAVAELKGGKTATATSVIFGGDIKTWSPESPYLYDLEVEILKEGVVTDKVSGYCAMRKIEVKKDDAGVPRIYLNNEQIFQMGPLDQGWWPDGLYTAPSDEALLYDIRIMKDLGFNMVRKHIKTEPARWYYHCDREGLLVWQDMPSPNLPKGSEEIAKKTFEDEARRIVKYYKNFPSIVHWVVFNEGWGQFDTERMTRLVDGWVNNLVPARFGKSSLICCASGWVDAEIGNIIDTHSYPSPSCPNNANRASVCGEYGGITLKVPGHIWPGGDFQYTTVETSEDFTAFFNRLCNQIQYYYYQGLNAAVYTQISDVEIEKNGIMTYDRKVIKPHSPTGLLRDKIIECVNMPRSDVKIKTILSTAKEHVYTWRYTTDNVPRRWFEKGFDDSSWSEGKAAFGANLPANSAYLAHTPWTTNQIFMRRWFYLGDIDEALINKFRFTVFHDDDIEIYLNGVLAASRSGCVFNYTPMDISDQALATLKPNSWNLIAISGKQGTGQQIMDAGISAYVTEDFEYTENHDNLDSHDYTRFPEPGSVTVPSFRKVTYEFRHTSDRNNVAWGDFDNDGRLEVIYSGLDPHAEGSDSHMSVMYHNDGNNGFTHTSNPIDAVYYACPTAIDFNNDGLLDLFVPGLSNKELGCIDDITALLFKNTGNGRFEETNLGNGAMGIAPIYNDTDGGRGRHWVSVGDYDNDGFPDIIVTGRDDYETEENGVTLHHRDRRAVYLYHNDGGERFTRVEKPLNGTDEFIPLARGSVYFADMDNDGYLDIVSSGYGLNEGNLHVYWNNGDGTFSERPERLYGSYDASCAIGDLDNDGYQDIVVAGFSANKGGGSTKSFFIYRNNGDRTFSMLNDSFCGFEGVDGATPALGDVNNDGLVDILVGGHGATHEITTWVYLNRGDFLFQPSYAYYNDPFGKLGSFSRISHGNNHLIDYDGDGLLDVWNMGWAHSSPCGKDCNTELYRNTSTSIVPNSAPDAPANLSVSYDKTTGMATFSWDAPADDTTPTEALRYNLYIKKDDTNTIMTVIPADPATGFIKTDQLTGALTTTHYSVKVPFEDARYTWGIQAIDNGKAASRFSTSLFNPAKTSSIKKKIADDTFRLYVTGDTVHYELGERYSLLTLHNAKGIVAATTTKRTGRISGLLPGVYVATATDNKISETIKIIINNQYEL